MRTDARHVTFATQAFRIPARLLRASARYYGFKTSVVYTPDHAALSDAWRNHPDIMRAKRGAGYWLWKPYIIADALAAAPEGAPVLYTDAGVLFIADPSALIAMTERHPICLFLSGATVHHHRQSEWTKRDCFIEMGADTEAFWRQQQLSAGFQLYRAGPEARAFVEDLKSAMGSVSRLTDQPNIHGKPNLPGFQDHRHDQSVLTILAQQKNVPVFPEPTQYSIQAGAGADAFAAAGVGYGQCLYLHRIMGSSVFSLAEKATRVTLRSLWRKAARR